MSRGTHVSGQTKLINPSKVLLGWINKECLGTYLIIRGTHVPGQTKLNPSKVLLGCINKECLGTHLIIWKFRFLTMVEKIKKMY